MSERISSVRITPNNTEVLQKLGLLSELAGSWHGHGFNLIARPNFEGGTNLYLQLNETDESLKVDPIGSPIPNRGLGQVDIELSGLTYLQKIADRATGGAMHIEPGIWLTQPETTYPPETTPPGTQIVARLGTIPHGNSLLAQGVAAPFDGPPTLKMDGLAENAEYAFSAFPSFNSTPIALSTIPPGPVKPLPPVFSAASSSAKGNHKNNPSLDFTVYDVSTPDSKNIQRTPYGTKPPEPPLPAEIDGVPMQEVVNDPIRLLQAVIEKQVAEGCTFKGVALNISTQAHLTFFTEPDSKPEGPTTVVTPTNGAGGTENILFLKGGEPTGPKGPNAKVATVYATFWIEEVSHPERPPFMQLQYAQMVVLDFPVLQFLPTVVDFGWPHISVATLRKTFN